MLALQNVLDIFFVSSSGAPLPTLILLVLLPRLYIPLLEDRPLARRLVLVVQFAFGGRFWPMVPGHHAHLAAPLLVLELCLLRPVAQASKEH